MVNRAKDGGSKGRLWILTNRKHLYQPFSARLVLGTPNWFCTWVVLASVECSLQVRATQLRYRPRGEGEAHASHGHAQQVKTSCGAQRHKKVEGQFHQNRLCRKVNESISRLWSRIPLSCFFIRRAFQVAPVPSEIFPPVPPREPPHQRPICIYNRLSWQASTHTEPVF